MRFLKEAKQHWDAAKFWWFIDDRDQTLVYRANDIRERRQY